MLDSARTRLWICAETLTDLGTLEALLRIASRNRELGIRLLTGRLSAIAEPALKSRIRTQFLPALAALGNCEWCELDQLHANLWVVDEAAPIGSVNPNKMNLGFGPRRGYWRSSVEAMHVVSSAEEARELAAAFELLWDRAAPAAAWDDVDWYVRAAAGGSVSSRKLAQVREDVAQARAAFYGQLAQAVRQRL